MTGLTAQDYQRIIATLADQKKVAELGALEWQVRAENAESALAALTAAPDTETSEEASS